jgi:hypothetical protein
MLVTALIQAKRGSRAIVGFQQRKRYETEIKTYKLW